MADLVNLTKIMETPRFEPLIAHTNKYFIKPFLQVLGGSVGRV